MYIVAEGGIQECMMLVTICCLMVATVDERFLIIASRLAAILFYAIDYMMRKIHDEKYPTPREAKFEHKIKRI